MKKRELSTIYEGEGDSLVTSELNSTRNQSETLIDASQKRRDEARCLDIQDLMGSKVVKYGKLYKNKGSIFQNYKEFEMFLLSNGLLLFYTLTESSKKYG